MYIYIIQYIAKERKRPSNLMVTTLYSPTFPLFSDLNVKYYSQSYHKLTHVCTWNSLDAALTNDFRWNSKMRNLSTWITLVSTLFNILDVTIHARIYTYKIVDIIYLTKMSRRCVSSPLCIIWQYIHVYVRMRVSDESSMHEQIC